MIELLEILLGFFAVALFMWLYVRLGAFLMLKFGLEGRRRASRVEIQTLFHGNTKDQDQL